MAVINMEGAREAAVVEVTSEKDEGEDLWRGRKGRIPGRSNSKLYM